MDKELVCLRIDTIIKHIDSATNDLNDVSFEDFKGTSLLARATAFSIEQICEHMTKIRKQYERAYPEIPWDKAYDMRIIIAHMYLEIDTKIVYKTVKNDLPLLKQQLLKLKEDIK